MKKIVDKGAEYKAKEAARVWKLMGDKSVLVDSPKLSPFHAVFKIL